MSLFSRANVCGRDGIFLHGTHTFRHEQPLTMSFLEEVLTKMNIGQNLRVICSKGATHSPRVQPIRQSLMVYASQFFLPKGRWKGGCKAATGISSTENLKVMP